MAVPHPPTPQDLAALFRDFAHIDRAVVERALRDNAPNTLVLHLHQTGRADGARVSTRTLTHPPERMATDDVEALLAELRESQALTTDSDDGVAIAYATATALAILHAHDVDNPGVETTFAWFIHHVDPSLRVLALEFASTGARTTVTKRAALHRW